MEVVAAAQKELDDILFIGSDGEAKKKNRQEELKHDIELIHAFLSSVST